MNDIQNEVRRLRSILNLCPRYKYIKKKKGKKGKGTIKVFLTIWAIKV